jgi:hypothetical protein
VVASGFCGLWVLAHPGYSQHYFWRIVIGLGVSLTVASAARLLPSYVGGAAVRSGLARYAVGGLAAGALVLAVDRTPAASVGGRLLPYAAVGSVLLVVLALSRHARTSGPSRRLPALVGVTCFWVAAALPATAADVATAVLPAVSGAAPASGPLNRYVTVDEQRAALWLHDHSDPGDLVATNVMCAPPPYRPDCPHVSFWVTALTGRQLWMGAWSYTEASMRQYAHRDESYQEGPSPWPGRVRLSLRAVRAPTAAVVAQLRRHGVDWVFADRRATAVSPRLARFAHLVRAGPDVLVFRLGPSHLGGSTSFSAMVRSLGCRWSPSSTTPACQRRSSPSGRSSSTAMLLSNHGPAR